MSPYPKRAAKAVPLLKIVTPVAALISVVNVAISLSTEVWLDSYERVPLETVNFAHNEEFSIRRSISGLWNLCVFNITEIQYLKHDTTVAPEKMNCVPIQYFNYVYQPDPTDSDSCIGYTVTKAGPLFIFASILLLIAIVCTIVGYMSRKCRIAIFIGGIIFIVSGLMLLIGLVVYISVLQSEMGTKLRPKNSMDAPPFEYKYGYSFILVVVGFMSTEMTGILATFFYIYWHQLDWFSKTASGSNTPVENVRTHHHRHHRHHNHHKNKFSISDHPERQSRHHRHREPDVTTSGSYFTYNESHCGRQRNPNGHYTLGSDSDDLEIPPIPPPPIPRDLTSLTNCSSDEFFPDVNVANNNKGKDKRTTHV